MPGRVLSHFATRPSLNTLPFFLGKRGFDNFRPTRLISVVHAKPRSVPIPIQGVATLARREQHIPKPASSSPHEINDFCVHIFHSQIRSQSLFVFVPTLKGFFSQVQEISDDQSLHDEGHSMSCIDGVLGFGKSCTTPFLLLNYFL